MPQAVQVGSIFIEEGPRMNQLLGLQSEPYTGNWSLLSVADGLAVNAKSQASGWSFFFMAEEVKATVWGVLAPKTIQNALRRILGKVRTQHFNGLEVTKIVAKRFLGVPYSVVSAHSRHLQQGCYLDDTEARRVSQHNAEWGRG